MVSVENIQGIDEEIYVNLQEQEQYLLIKGEDVKNPVIVYLHGGPAGPDSVVIYEWATCLTDKYTVVVWDQRGCGNTYYRNKEKDPDNKTATFPQALEDLDALVDYVCQRFGQEKVIIMGHSYGTLLGSRYAQIHPEKVQHYVGISQVISIILGEKAGYEDAYRIAVEKGKNTAKLTAAYEKAMEEPTFDNLGKLRMKTMPLHMPPKAKNQIILGLKSPYLKWNNVKWQLMCMTNRKKIMRLSQSLLDYMFKANLLEEPKDYRVPVTFIHGDCDWVTPAVCTKQYMDRMTAPHKEMVLMKDCSHSPHYDEPEEFAELLTKVIIETERLL